MSHVETTIRDTLVKISKENNIDNVNIEIKPFSSEGANYTSHLYLAKLSGSKEINVFAKIAAVGEKMRAQTSLKIYDTERYFYTDLVKIYKQLEDKNNLAEENRLRVPKFYGCNANLYEETIVLEDLGVSGFSTYDRMKSIEWDYASAAVTELAKFHALSMAYKQINEKKFTSDVEKLKIDWVKNQEMRNMQDSFKTTAINAANEEHKERFKNYLKNDVFEDYKELTAPKKITIIVHGDYRPSNLMHRTREDGTLEVVPVDFQTLRDGSPVIDLLYFIFTGSDENFRRHHYQELVEHYYQQLSNAMKRLGMDPEEVYSREDFGVELKEKLAFGLLIGVFLLPIVTVEAENAPKVDKDMEISSFSVKKTGDLFPERLNGIINDYVRWGYL